MNKKMLTIILILSVAASTIMFAVGSGSSHLSELADFFWAPLPLAVIALIGLMLKKKT